MIKSTSRKGVRRNTTRFICDLGEEKHPTKPEFPSRSVNPTNKASSPSAFTLSPAYSVTAADLLTPADAGGLPDAMSPSGATCIFISSSKPQVNHCESFDEGTYLVSYCGTWLVTRSEIGKVENNHRNG